MFDAEILKKTSATISQLMYNLKDELGKVGSFIMGHPQVRDYEGIHYGQNLNGQDKRLFAVFQNLCFKADNETSDKLYKLIDSAIKGQKLLSNYLAVHKIENFGVWVLVQGTSIPKTFAESVSTKMDVQLEVSKEMAATFIQSASLDEIEALSKEISKRKKELKKVE